MTRLAVPAAVFCVNPEHLEAVPHRVNVLRGRSPAAITHREARETCLRGHPYTRRRQSDGAPICRVCERAAEGRYREKKRMARSLGAV